MESEPETNLLEVETETLLSGSDNEVTIAAIEADKEIALAEINANARLAEAEIYSETAKETAQEEDNKWLILVSMIERMGQEMGEMRAELSQRLSSLETMEAVETLTQTETDLTPLSTVEETNLTLMEATEKSEDEKPEAEPEPEAEVLEIKIAGKPIVRLV